MDTLTVTLVQFGAGPDPEQNLDTIERLLADVRGPGLATLPEVCTVRGDDNDYLVHADTIPGHATERLAHLARERRLWILCGSLVEKSGADVYNTSVLVDPSGRTCATYRKIHLFEATLDNGRVIRESSAYCAGSSPCLMEIDGWRCGMSICYDVRFPELYRHYSREGAHVLCVPANFTQHTGKDHWEILLRCRAIENQCFVVAPNQCGTNQRTGVASYGHSMIVGPWGDILCRAGDHDSVVTATVDPDTLAAVRQRVPALRHRRL